MAVINFVPFIPMAGMAPLTPACSKTSPVAPAANLARFVTILVPAIAGITDAMFATSPMARWAVGGMGGSPLHASVMETGSAFCWPGTDTG